MLRPRVRLGAQLAQPSMPSDMPDIGLRTVCAFARLLYRKCSAHCWVAACSIACCSIDAATSDLLFVFPIRTVPRWVGIPTAARGAPPGHRRVPK